MCRGQRTVLGNWSSPSTLFESRSTVGLLVATYATLVSEGCLSFPSYLKSTGIEDGCFHALLYMASRTLSPGPQVCTANVLSTEPSPQALEISSSCIFFTTPMLNCIHCKENVMLTSKSSSCYTWICVICLGETGDCLPICPLQSPEANTIYKVCI